MEEVFDCCFICLSPCVVEYSGNVCCSLTARRGKHEFLLPTHLSRFITVKVNGEKKKVNSDVCGGPGLDSGFFFFFFEIFQKSDDVCDEVYLGIFLPRCTVRSESIQTGSLFASSVVVLQFFILGWTLLDPPIYL